ncbi:MAG TPA: pyrroloquinoline quinone biosynthesis peptide chaperone PqqD [Bryobacteraceae bacterium]|nr:pyrroloquinoline quinone biosynthesis peptide chaperone PqqD [Bryobacteraceae bacterium]
MSAIARDARPKLRPGCRLNPSTPQGPMLLIPEGALRLVGPGQKIVERCDGEHTFDDVVRELKAEYPTAEPARIETEVTSFLTRLHEKRVIDL